MPEKSETPEQSIEEGPPERVTTGCAGCHRLVTTFWAPGNRGMLSSPDCVLVADWVFHDACWDVQLRKGGML